MNRTVRLGMIGCGLISHAHGRASQKSDRNIRFVACASRSEERAGEWARAYGCDRHYTDYRDMLRHRGLEGVVIATWPVDHREHIEAALDAGLRHVLCEKSLTVSAEDALAVWEGSRAVGATVVEGFMYRYHPAIARLRELVDAGTIGEIDNIRGGFSMLQPGAAKSASANWRSRPETGGGVVHDFACYPVDAINLLAGDLPLRVTAGGSRISDSGVLTRMAGIIEYRNGVLGLVESSHGAVFSQPLEIAGSKGRLSMPVAWAIRDDAVIVHSWSEGFLELSRDETRIPQPAPHDGRLVDLPVFQLQLERFAASIRGAEPPGIGLAESVVNAIVLDSLLESARRERVVECRIPTDIAASAAVRGRP